MPTEGFSYNGGWQSWPVPDGVEWVEVDVTGAGSGTRQAGKVTGKVNVKGVDSLRIKVGQAGRVTSGQNGGGDAFGGGGAGGDGHGGNDGGNGGGGGTFIRRNSNDGTLVCAAGGAGGTSGDAGNGGRGGAGVGESGDRGTSGSNATGNATGGTQSQAGNKGTSSSGNQFDGNNGSADQGGHGGGPGNNNAGHGGGGGGGGYKGGGGGQASSKTFAPGGGGGGGSNYTGGLVGAASTQGNGGTGDGHATLTWDAPPPANQPPSPPSNVKIDGKTGNGVATKSTFAVDVTAELNDPDQDRVRMYVRYSNTPSFGWWWEVTSESVKSGDRATVRLNKFGAGLDQDTLWYFRAWGKDSKDKFSNNFNSGNFWTNRRPNGPTLVTPADNVSISDLLSITFDWTHNDPDPADPQQGFELRWRTAATLASAAGEWHTVSRPGDTASQWVTDPGTFKASTFYEWTVRTRDQQGRWGDWAGGRSFYSSGTSAPPIPKSPIKNDALDANEDVTLKWKFVDPAPGEEQTKADVRWRIAGSDDTHWITRLGSVTEPNGDRFWTFPGATFAFPGYHYEWQVRTYNTGAPSVASDWSDSGFFWTTGTPGAEVGRAPSASTLVQGSLGCGSYRAFIYDRGGKMPRGEIMPIATLNFRRLRDDIGSLLLTTNGWDDDCGQLLAAARSWMHEIVLWRDGVRVWEGPITRITYRQDAVEFEAKDCMAYLYRRIMRQGYNDSYRVVDGEQIGLTTVTRRAQQIIVNALAPSDPNLLPFLTTFTFEDDARQSRVVPDYSMTAWEQIDDLAATAGLDYTTVGRRIILWDTHRPIGRLPEMRDEDFSDPPIVSEYGMQLANYAAVTNNSGVWGAARPKHEEFNGQYYGPVEMLASAYGESDGGAEARVLTRAAREKLEDSMREQARRNIADRWPTPVIVRVPDNSNLNPDVEVGFDQLIPGVWIPLRSTGTLRDVAQWQKLDSVTVTYDNGIERVQVVMSPAPNGGEDPDAQTDSVGETSSTKLTADPDEGVSV